MALSFRVVNSDSLPPVARNAGGGRKSSEELEAMRGLKEGEAAVFDIPEGEDFEQVVSSLTNKAQGKNKDGIPRVGYQAEVEVDTANRQVRVKRPAAAPTE